LSDSFKSVSALDKQGIDIFDRYNEFLNKSGFFVTVFDQSSFFCLNTFFKDRNIDGDWSMVRQQPPIQMDMMIVEFRRIWTKKDEINDRICLSRVVRISG